MKHWYVVTPEYDEVDVICDGQGPIETVADIIEIEAETKRDAISLGVKEMLKPWYGKGEHFKWCKYQRSDNASPYAGVKAFPVEEPDEVQVVS